MKNIKIKFLSFTLILILLITNIFSVYSSTYYVYAENDSTDDIIENIILAIGTIGGIVFTGTTQTLFAAAAGIATCYKAGEFIGDYITDNGDGTIIISADGIQSTIDALELYDKVKGFDDAYIHGLSDNVKRQYNYFAQYSFSSNNLNSYYYRDGVTASYSGRVAAYLLNTNDCYKYCAYTAGFNIMARVKGTNYLFVNGSNIILQDFLDVSCSFTKKANYVGFSGNFMADFPVFSNIEAMKNYLNTGEGYENALNYNKTEFQIAKSSRYSNSYTGGDVTLRKDKVIELPDFVLNNIDPTDDADENDQKINDWLFDDEDDDADEQPTEPETEPESEPEKESEPDIVPEPDDDNDDNKKDDEESVIDLSPLTDILERIYDKLCEILENISQGFDYTFEGFDSVLTYLDDITDQLKEIKRWTAYISAQIDELEKFTKNPKGGIDELVNNAITKFKAPVELLITKFPFSIPWDMLIILEFFAEAPDVPYFEIPFVLESYGIDYTVVVDLSKFEPLSKLSRILLTILYIIGLMKVTTKIIQKGVTD